MTVLVSHRFSTVRMAEHIVYLEEGRLVEQGRQRRWGEQGRDGDRRPRARATAVAEKG